MKIHWNKSNIASPNHCNGYNLEALWSTKRFHPLHENRSTGWRIESKNPLEMKKMETAALVGSISHCWSQ